MNILVLGSYPRDMFGGIVDTDKLTDSIDDVRLLKAINEALAEQNANPDLFCGSAEILDGYTNETVFESMPFTGTIDAEVLIYVD